MIKGPSLRPCTSCPYRRDVPSGIWDATEYAKLPAYDSDTAYQPSAPFVCHQQDGHVCAGWAGCHDGYGSLALRLAAAMGTMAADDIQATIDYVSPVPLFRSGREAAQHGMEGIANPSPGARRVINKILRRRA